MLVRVVELLIILGDDKRLRFLPANKCSFADAVAPTADAGCRCRGDFVGFDHTAGSECVNTFSIGC